MRVAGLEPVVDDLESLAAQGVGADRHPIPFHSGFSIGATSYFVRREQGSPGTVVHSCPNTVCAARAPRVHMSRFCSRLRESIVAPARRLGDLKRRRFPADGV